MRIAFLAYFSVLGSIYSPSLFTSLFRGKKKTTDISPVLGEVEPASQGFLKHSSFSAAHWMPADTDGLIRSVSTTGEPRISEATQKKGNFAGAPLDGAACPGGSVQLIHDVCRRLQYSVLLHFLNANHIKLDSHCEMGSARICFCCSLRSHCLCVHMSCFLEWCSFMMGMTFTLFVYVL